MRIPLFVFVRSLFARNKDEYWWAHFTDEEKKLKRMDVWQLAKVINDARVHNLAGEQEKIIVAEHMLSERLARIQARPGHIAIYTGLVGIVGGAFLSSALQPNNELECVCECKTDSSIQHVTEKPVQTKIAIPAITDVIDKPATEPQKRSGNDN